MINKRRILYRTAGGAVTVAGRLLLKKIWLLFLILISYIEIYPFNDTIEPYVHS